MRKDQATMRLTRRAALLAASSLPLAGCSLYDSWFGAEKAALPGKRIPVMPAAPEIAADAGAPPVTLPPAVAIPDAAQPGGTPTHSGGHMQARPELTEAWSSSIGSGAGYRARLTAPPVIAGGRVFTMDSDARVTAFDAATGAQIWRATTRDKDDRSTNVGGGVTVADGIVYAATGRADMLAYDAATGQERWRQRLPTPARSSPTVADQHIYVATIDDTLVALNQADGTKLWSHQAPPADTSVLGLPAPLATDGLVIAGFSSGELRALRVNAGTNAWGDSLAAARGRVSIADLASIRGMPASIDGRLYAGGLGKLLVALDLRSGRRLWEREVAIGEMPWIAGDWLFVVTIDAVVTAIARLDGRAAWALRLDAWEDMEKRRDAIIWSGPVLAGGRLYLAGSNGQLVTIDPISGKRLATRSLAAGAALAPVPAGGALYVLTVDGTLTCFR
jgi:outer membrane protein assembly factor BamB